MKSLRAGALVAMLLFLGSPLCLAADATLTIKSFTPAAGTTVRSRTILRAEIEYRIDNFDPRATYVIAPFFDHVNGVETFNEIPASLDAKHLKEMSGVVKLTYPISREWASGYLAKPIKVVYRILEVTKAAEGGHTIMGIGDSDTITYEVGE